MSVLLHQQPIRRHILDLVQWQLHHEDDFTQGSLGPHECDVQVRAEGVRCRGRLYMLGRYLASFRLNGSRDVTVTQSIMDPLSQLPLKAFYDLKGSELVR